MKLINAHVIPRSFFEIVRGNVKYAIEMQARSLSLATPYRQAGVADPGILCEPCERRFTPWDTYGFEVLGRQLSAQKEHPIRASDGTIMAIPLKKVDYELLTLFLLSVTWRASVSTLHFYKHVQLGPYEELLRNVLLTNAAPPFGEYTVILGTSLENRFKTSMPHPERVRLETVNHCVLYFPNVFASVKIDKRSLPDWMHVGMLQPREVNIVLCYPFATSPYAGFFAGLNRTLHQLRHRQD